MSETKGHDPNCPMPNYPYTCPRCALIALVRADERLTNNAYGLTAARAKADEEQAVAQDLGPAATPTQVGYDAGRAGAFADVLALLREARA